MKNTTNFSSKLGVSKIFILVIIAVLVIGGIFVWQKWLKSDLRLKIKDSRLPKGIEVIEQGDKKIVRNKAEGYEVTVPKEWEVRGSDTKYIVTEKIYKKFGPQTAIVGEFSIEVFEKKGDISLLDWIKQNKPLEEDYIVQPLTPIKIGNLSGYKRTERLIDEVEYTSYYFLVGENIYIIAPNVLARFPDVESQKENQVLVQNIEKDLEDIIKSLIINK
jgi:hypothetical protein